MEHFSRTLSAHELQLVLSTDSEHYHCCFSELFSTAWKRRIRKGGGRVFLASSSSTQKSYQHGKLSLFTHFLVEGIDDHIEVDIHEEMPVEILYEYVETRIKEIKPEMEPALVFDGKGNKIPITTNSVLLSDFRNQVKKYIRDDNTISVYSQETIILEQHREELGIPEEDAKRIIDEVLKDIRKQTRHRRAGTGIV